MGEIEDTRKVLLSFRGVKGAFLTGTGSALEKLDLFHSVEILLERGSATSSPGPGDEVDFRPIPSYGNVFRGMEIF